MIILWRSLGEFLWQLLSFLQGIVLSLYFSVDIFGFYNLTFTTGIQIIFGYFLACLSIIHSSLSSYSFSWLLTIFIRPHWRSLDGLTISDFLIVFIDHETIEISGPLSLEPRSKEIIIEACQSAVEEVVKDAMSSNWRNLPKKNPIVILPSMLIR